MNFRKSSRSVIQVYLISILLVLITIIGLSTWVMAQSEFDNNLRLALDTYQYLIDHTKDDTSANKTVKIDIYYHKGLCHGYLGESDEAEATFQELWEYYNAPTNNDIKENSEVKQKIVDAGCRIARFIADNMDTVALRDKATGMVNQVDVIFPQYDELNVKEETTDPNNEEEEYQRIQEMKYRRIQMTHTEGYIGYKTIEKLNSPTSGIIAEPLDVITKFREIFRYPNPPAKAKDFIDDSYYFAGQAAMFLVGFTDKWNIARGFFDNYVQRAPDGKHYLNALISIAQTYYEDGNYKDEEGKGAITKFNDLIQLLSSSHPSVINISPKLRDEYLINCHYYLGKSYASVNPPRNLDALSEFDTILSMDLDHSVSPDALNEIMSLTYQERNNLSNAVSKLTWLTARHPGWAAQNKHPKIPERSDLEKILLLIDEEIVTLYPDSTYVTESYHNIGMYYTNIGVAYYDLWSDGYQMWSNDPRSVPDDLKANIADDFNNCIKHYRIAYDFCKKAYQRGKQNSGTELKNLITSTLVPTSTTYEAKRLIDATDVPAAIAVYNSVISLLIDMNSLISGSAAQAITTLEHDIKQQGIINLQGGSDIIFKKEVILNQNSTNAPQAYSDLASERLELAKGWLRDYNGADSPDATKKREYFLLAVNDYEMVYEYSKKIYEHPSASNEEKDAAKEQIRQVTDALANLCINHAGFLEQNKYQRSAINAYNIAVSHLKDVNNHFSDIVTDSINSLSDGGWKSKLLAEFQLTSN